MHCKTIQPKMLSFFLAYQIEEEDSFCIPEYKLYVFSKLTPEGYGLVFVLNKKIEIDNFCEDFEKRFSVLIKKKDVPWRGFETSFLLTLTPVNCTKGIALPTLKLNIYSGDSIFHWDQIAMIIFSEELINYLEWLKNNYGINYKIIDT